VLAPFEVTEPSRDESPVVVEVPHAGLQVDAEALSTLFAPAQRIGHDADLFVDELFDDAPREGATLLVARASRYVVDLNRGPTDYDADAAEGGSGAWPRGLFWRLTTEGERLGARLSAAEVERRLEHVYRPYHRALSDLIERKRARFGFAVVVCAHSMPSLARGGVEPAAHRADIVPGTRARTSASPLVIDRLDAHARAHGYTVRHDDPYKGGYSTAHYGQPARGVHVVQVEIARRLYMDEPSLTRIPKGFLAVRQFARTLVERLAFPDLADAAALLGPAGGSRASRRRPLARG
jgi:N-formylglutamate amidohydrolase